MADSAEDEEANLTTSVENDDDRPLSVIDSGKADGSPASEKPEAGETVAAVGENSRSALIEDDTAAEGRALIASPTSENNQADDLNNSGEAHQLRPLTGGDGADDANGPRSPLPEIRVDNDSTPTLSSWWQSCYRSPLLLIYVSHGLSSWGDRMWAFTMGMLLIDWEQLQSLRTVAIHQLCCAIAVFIFGALIGSWVDRSRRLRATVSSIITQNVFVCLSAVVLLVLLRTTQDRDKTQPALLWHHFAIALSIAFSTFAYLASVACQLTVVKDWVPTLCHENRAKLTSANAILKRIDLTTAILSPLLAGAAMEAAGPWAGAVVVVIWNVISAPCEILLLFAVYRRHTLLHAPKQPRPQSSASATSESTHGAKKLSSDCITKVPIMRPAVTLVRGWSCYWQQIVRWAGASLSCLYFTVLSFDAVTTGYVRSLCVSELVVAAVRIGSFVFGLVGTIVFPHIRKACGLRRGGAIFYIGHAAILALAVVSIFLPGSPFEPINGIITTPNAVLWSNNNISVAGNESSSAATTLLLATSTPALTDDTDSTVVPNFLTNVTEATNSTQRSASALGPQCVPGDNVGGFRYPHLWLLTGAVILSRLTLWGSDLSINQALVERVDPKKRGVVNGVQGSLNQLVDLFRLVTVICVPYPSQFGWLVIATFLWIVGGAVLYVLGAPADEVPVQRHQRDRFARNQ